MSAARTGARTRSSDRGAREDACLSAATAAAGFAVLLAFATAAALAPALAQEAPMIESRAGAELPAEVEESIRLRVEEETPALVVGMVDAEVARGGDALFIQATGQPRFRAFAASDTEFFLRVVPATFEFRTLEDGGLEMALNQGGRTSTGRKR